MVLLLLMAVVVVVVIIVVKRCCCRRRYVIVVIVVVVVVVVIIVAKLPIPHYDSLLLFWCLRLLMAEVMFCCLPVGFLLRFTLFLDK